MANASHLLAPLQQLYEVWQVVDMDGVQAQLTLMPLPSAGKVDTSVS
jgi:hypothetical protein